MAELQALIDSGFEGLVDIPAALYHSGPGISSSGLKTLLRSPAHYAAYLANPPDSEAMRKGRAVHSFVLERESFDRDFVVAPSGIDRRTNAGKAAWEDFQASTVGRSTISGDDLKLCHELYVSIGRNELANQALLSDGGHNEISVFWKDPETGILCKARADRLKNGVIFDLKTTQDAQAREFQRSIALYGYHLSAAFYVDGFATVLEKAPEFSWIAVEKTAPHGIAFYAASDDALAVGRAEYAQALRAYQEYLKPRATGSVVPGYPQRFETLGLPNWYAVKEAAV